MKLRALDLPDDPAELAPWLERQVVGGDLADLVAELEVVHARSSGAEPPALDTVLSGHLPSVLHQGLGELPRPALGTLLRNPRLLLELQERVLLEGGDHWSDLAREDPEVLRRVDASWKDVESRIRQATSREFRAPETLPIERPLSVTRPPRVGLIMAWAKCATIAASVLAFLFTVERLNPEKRPATPNVIAKKASPDWGWNTPGLLTRVEPPAAYLTHLADAANEWFDKRPETPGDLAFRLGELRTGCTRLIVARNTSLQPADQAWLVNHCRDWAAKLDKAVHDLEQGDPVDRVRSEVDAIVTRLIGVLRDRAKAV
jgi:hypothetical protein